MDQESTSKISRRAALKQMSFLACTVPITIAVLTSSSGAQGKASKAAASYQDSPKGSQQCSGCINFIPPNTCKVVDGEVSPHGWCSLWTSK